MRKLFTTFAAVAALCAFAAAATPALASEFTASRSTPLTEESPGATKGIAQEGEFSQELRFGVFTIKCSAHTKAKTVAEGAIDWETSATFTTQLKFTKCLTDAKYGSFVGGTHTRFNEGLPMRITYYSNGNVELGGAAASFSISGKVCKISWPAQLVVETKAQERAPALYENKEVAVPSTQFKKFPSGFQQRLKIDNELRGMEYEYEEGQCLGEGGFEEEAKHAEGKSGTWIGKLEEQMIGGNLGIA